MTTTSTPDAGDAEVLRRRAERLARAPAADAIGAAATQVLEFAVGAQRCLLDTDCLREVQLLRDLMPVPMAAAALAGIVQWRGRMLPVLDLAALLALSGTRQAATRMLVLGRQAAVLALAVGEVHGLQLLAADEVERRSQPLEGMRPDIVRGVTRDGHLFLDGERLLQRGAAP